MIVGLEELLVAQRLKFDTLITAYRPEKVMEQLSCTMPPRKGVV
jgi:hypothetical protein